MNKDIGSPFQPLSPEGKEILQSLVDNVHSQFVSAVAKGRGMNEAQVRKLADGRVYSGAQAKELGLVDQFGTLDDAIEFAAKRVGLEENPTVYYSSPEEERWWEKIFLQRSAGVSPPRNEVGSATNGRPPCSSSEKGDCQTSIQILSCVVRRCYDEKGFD